MLSEIKWIVSSLHDASLLIDDVEDGSNLRRGVPVAHAIFGTAPTINAANYVYFLALERCMALGNEGAMRVSFYLARVSVFFSPSSLDFRLAACCVAGMLVLSFWVLRDGRGRERGGGGAM